MKPIFYLLVTFCLITSLRTQDYLITDFRNISDFANQAILDGVQGPDGRLYFLTTNELLAFDGNKFSAIKEISDSYFFSKDIITDDQSNIWFFSSVGKNELIKYDGFTFKSIPIGKHIKGIYAHTVKDSKIVFATNRDELYSFENNSWREINLPRLFSGSSITDLEIIDKQLWISTNKGTFVFNDSSYQSNRVVTKKSTYDIYFDDSDSTIFLLNENKLGVFRNDSLQMINTGIPLGTDDRVSKDIIRISDSEVIIGTDKSHYILNTHNWKLTYFNEVYDIKPAHSTKIFRDSFNNLWVCSNLGIIRINKSLFNNLKKTDGLLANYVSSISQFDNGNILVGHLTGMTFIKDNSFIEIPLNGKDGQQLSHVIDLIIDKQQSVWFLIQNRGIGRIDNIDNFKEIKWFNDSNYLTMTELKTGEIFIASRNGFHKINNNDVNKVYDIKDLPNIYFRRVIEASDSIAIAIARSHVFIYDLLANNVKHNLEYINNMYSAYEYDKEILIGGKPGLFRKKENNLSKIPINTISKKSPEVYFINGANEGEIWLGTNKGIFQLIDNNIRHFSSVDGLSDNELTRSSFVFDKENQRIWVGTISGLSSLDLEELNYRTVKPKVWIDRKNTLNEKGKLFLNYYGVSLYPQPELKYFIKVEGESSGYHNEFFTVDQNITLENLEEDNYKLSIKAVDRFSNESEEIFLEYKIENRIANATFYKIVIIVVAIVIVLFLIIRKRSPKITNIEAEEKSSFTVSQSFKINTFGSLTIINVEGENITHKFTPKLEELFVLLLIYTFDQRKTINGISSEKLSNHLWNDSSDENIKNKRNTLIKRLREFLKAEKLGEIIFEQKKWILRLNEKLRIDYVDWTKLREKINSDLELNVAESNSLISIIKKGNFLSSNNYDWLEEIKIWHDRECSNTLTKILHNENLEIELRLRAGNTLVSIDPLNESEVIYFIKLLNNSNRLSQAAEIYKKFNIEYYNLFGKEYKSELNDILT